MEAKDLMIGDWVLYNGEPYQIRQLGIYGVDRDGEDYPAVCVGRPNSIGLVLERNEIEPIPLTPEILEKNGFVENRFVTSWEFETDGESLIDIYGFEGYHLSINIEDTHGSGKGYRWLLNNLVIFYVHELQHALRLCKTEKEIIL